MAWRHEVGEYEINKVKGQDSSSIYIQSMERESNGDGLGGTCKGDMYIHVCIIYMIYMINFKEGSSYK